MSLTIYPIEPDCCPVCQQQFTAVSPVDSSMDELPEEGDPSLCINCGTLLIFDHALRQVLPPAEFLAEFSPAERDAIIEIQKVLRQAITGGSLC